MIPQDALSVSQSSTRLSSPASAQSTLPSLGPFIWYGWQAVQTDE